MSQPARYSWSNVGRLLTILIACALIALLWIPVKIGYHQSCMAYAWTETFHPDRLWTTRMRAYLGLPDTRPPPGQLGEGLAAIVRHRGALEGLGYFRRTVLDLPVVSLTSSNAMGVVETIGHLNSVFPYFELRVDSVNSPSNLIGVAIVAPQERLDFLRAQFAESIKNQP